MKKLEIIVVVVGMLMMVGLLVAISFISLPFGVFVTFLVVLPWAAKGLADLADWLSRKARHRLGKLR